MDEELSSMQKEMDTIHLELEAVQTAVSESRKEELSSLISMNQHEMSYIPLQEAEKTVSTNTIYNWEKNKVVSIKDKYEEIQDLRDSFVGTSANSSKHVSAVGSLNTTTEMENLENSMSKVKELFSYLKAEKAARKDLEMYVAVLNTQKTMLQDESYKVNSELQIVCHLLDEEKQSHEALKQTWQRANDQFLESQRLMMMDLRRMEAVLTTEQQRQITELRKKAANDVPVKILLNVPDNHEGNSLPIRRQASLPEFRKLQQKSETRETNTRKSREVDEKKKIELEQEEKWKFKQTQIRRVKSRSREQSPAYGSPTSKSKSTAIGSIPIINDGTHFKQHSSSSGGVCCSTSSSDVGDDVTLDEFNDIMFLNSYETPPLEEEDKQNIQSTTVVRITPEKVLTLPSLTAAQMKAITDPTPETEAYKSMVAGIKSKFGTSELDLGGKRLVSEEEWALLEEEMRASREKLGQPCSMCFNYEAELQSVQQELKSIHTEMKRLESTLSMEKQKNKNLWKCQEELQLALKNAAEDVQSQITCLTNGLEKCEKCVYDFKDQMSTTHLQLQDYCKTLTENREEVHCELTKLQQENDTLIGKYSITVQQLQSQYNTLEQCNNSQSQYNTLPDTLEEMQLLLVKYQKEIILLKVAKEQMEQVLKNEIDILKSQFSREQKEKLTLEETMSQEITSLHAKVAAELNTLKEELKQEATLRLQTEAKLRETESVSKSIQSKSKQAIVKMQENLEEMDEKKGKLESENHKLRVKVQSLQADLRNSEAVQRDFVKLSQSLQIQLEKIRQADNEVRWQHEDDVNECSNCKLLFTVTRRKHHCRHCGRVFCADCTTKSVISGPNHRATKVCDVCHTILVNDATPYFGTEAPAT